MNISDLVNISLTDKGKSEILEKFGEYSPVSLERWFMEKGASEPEAKKAASDLKTMKQVDFQKVLPWIIGGISVITILTVLLKNKKR